MDFVLIWFLGLFIGIITGFATYYLHSLTKEDNEDDQWRWH